MSISVVNGYLCMSACEAAKARTGQNPHPQPATDQTSSSKPDWSRTPAVTFGGSLSGRSAVAPVGAGSQSGGAGPYPPPATIDIQA